VGDQPHSEDRIIAQVMNFGTFDDIAADVQVAVRLGAESSRLPPQELTHALT
jgi:hypothetical protein